MKKFNLEEAKAGKEVVTRGGKPVRILCYDRKSTHPIVALVPGEVTDCLYTYHLDGSMIGSDYAHDYDLCMKTVEHTGYALIFSRSREDIKGTYLSTIMYDTEEAAREAGAKFSNFIGITKVTWEE